MEYLNAFLCGGLLCAVGQIILDRTNLTPARILTGYVVAGVFLQAVGVYQYVVDWGGAGPPCPSPASAIRWPKASPGPWRKRACWASSPAGSPPPPAASPQPWCSAS